MTAFNEPPGRTADHDALSGERDDSAGIVHRQTPCFSVTLGPVDDPIEHFSQQGFIQFLAFEPVEAGGRAVIRLDPNRTT